MEGVCSAHHHRSEEFQHPETRCYRGHWSCSSCTLDPGKTLSRLVIFDGPPGFFAIKQPSAGPELCFVVANCCRVSRFYNSSSWSFLFVNGQFFGLRLGCSTLIISPYVQEHECQSMLCIYHVGFHVKHPDGTCNHQLLWHTPVHSTSIELRLHNSYFHVSRFDRSKIVEICCVANPVGLDAAQIGTFANSLKKSIMELQLGVQVTQKWIAAK